MHFTEHPLEDVLPLLTENPANLLHMGSRKGYLKPGWDADMVLLDDGLNVVRTFVGGRTVYQKG